MTFSDIGLLLNINFSINTENQIWGSWQKEKQLHGREWVFYWSDQWSSRMTAGDEKWRIDKVIDEAGWWSSVLISWTNFMTVSMDTERPQEDAAIYSLSWIFMRSHETASHWLCEVDSTALCVCVCVCVCDPDISVLPRMFFTFLFSLEHLFFKNEEINLSKLLSKHRNVCPSHAWNILTSAVMYWSL